MKLESIELTNFRNIRSLRLKADAGVNIIHGENAQGKTNLTEAIWMFTGAKSFRGAKDKEMIRFGETSCKSSITFSSTMREQCASIELFSSENVSPDRKLKHIELNGITLESTSELAGQFYAVVFSPSHLALIREGLPFAGSFWIQQFPRFFPVMSITSMNIREFCCSATRCLKMLCVFLN